MAMPTDGYTRSMSVEVASRDLRNHTAELLRRVEAGEEIVITVRGRPMAKLTPLSTDRRRPIPRDEMAERLRNRQTDPAFKALLSELSETIGGDGLDDLWRSDS